MASKIKIVPPSVPDPTEIPPENDQSFKASNGGFDLIRSIYDFFTAHDALMYSTYKKYKSLGINGILDFFFLIISFLVDTLHNIGVYVALLIIMLVVVFSFAKLVGFLDFILSLHLFQ